MGLLDEPGLVWCTEGGGGRVPSPCSALGNICLPCADGGSHTGPFPRALVGEDGTVPESPGPGLYYTPLTDDGTLRHFLKEVEMGSMAPQLPKRAAAILPGSWRS